MFLTLQFCRAIAALLVLIFHCGATLATAKYFGDFAKPIQSLFLFGGEAGVGFFFVLSGFIISHVHWPDCGHPEKLLAYIIKRLLRIYPTYFIVFTLVYIVAYLMPSLRQSIPSDSLIILKSLLLIPQDKLVVGGTGAPVIIVAWSLQYEIVFYLAFAVAVISKRFFSFLAIAFVIGYVTNQLGLVIYTFPFSFMTSYHVLLFCMGLLVSMLVRSQIKLNNPLLYVALSSISFLIIGIIENCTWETHSKQLFYLLYGLISSILVFSLIKYESALVEKPKQGLLSLVGDSSYVIYLVHFPLVSVMCKLAVAVLPRSQLNAWASFIMITVICIYIGIKFHLLIEKPMLKRLNMLAKKYIQV